MNTLLIVIIVLLGMTCPAGAAGPSSSPGRIVSLAPSMTEILFALGLGDNIVGVTTFCDYPEEAKKKPKIGGMSNPSLEAIVALEAGPRGHDQGRQPSGSRRTAPLPEDRDLRIQSQDAA